MTSACDLVVLSHLRWTWVWQRPQHLVSRLARDRRVWFVEEPGLADVPAPRLLTEQHGPVTRVIYEIPRDGRSDPPSFGGEGHISFDARGAEGMGDALAALVSGAGPVVAWLYTPLALPLADALAPAALVYDVMDDLASFAFARPALGELQRRALEQA